MVGEAQHMWLRSALRGCNQIAGASEAERSAKCMSAGICSQAAGVPQCQSLPPRVSHTPESRESQVSDR
jgi:hypothetical protein